MKYFRYFHKAPIRVTRINQRRQRIRLRRAMLGVKAALAQERLETRQMLDTYRRFTQGRASKDEMKVANAQLVDVLKGLGLGVFALLPFAPVTIPLLIKVGKWVGVDVLPSAFQTPKAPESKAKED